MRDSKRKLRPKDSARFADMKPALLSELAITICKAGILPEKELHECWEMAQIVHKAFPFALHIADVAAGHGLLAWILVLLARSGESPVARTAVAVDICRPKSARILADLMIERWPHLSEAVYFVEGSVEAVRTTKGPETLFASVHACGGLSDRVLIAALRCGSPVAIMPCCHSLRNQRQTLTTLGETYGLAIDDVQPNPASIDQFRAAALRTLGYEVFEANITPEITKFNRIIIGRPSATAGVAPHSLVSEFKCFGEVKSLGAIQAWEKVKALDVADLNEARTLSMRPSREWVRSFDLSFWVGDLDSDSVDAAKQFEKAIARAGARDGVEIRVHVQDRFSCHRTNRLSMTFRIELTSSTAVISKEDALQYRDMVCKAMDAGWILRR